MSRRSCCCIFTSDVSLLLLVYPAVSGVSAVAGITSFPDIPIVAGVALMLLASFAGAIAVHGIPTVAGVPVDAGVSIWLVPWLFFLLESLMLLVPMLFLASLLLWESLLLLVSPLGWCYCCSWHPYYC
jgi:SpoU rRNA methylase family enzyme